MSILIDELCEKHKDIETEINGRWYCAKTLTSTLTPKTLWLRVIDAFRVLIGKSKAYHYKEDELI